MNTRATKKAQRFNQGMDDMESGMLEEQSLRNFMSNNKEIFRQFGDWTKLGDTTFVRRSNGCMPNGISSVVRKAIGYKVLAYKHRMGYKLTDKGKEYLNGEKITA